MQFVKFFRLKIFGKIFVKFRKRKNKSTFIKSSMVLETSKICLEKSRLIQATEVKDK